MTDFDMPPAPAPWEVRGGWVVKQLAADLDLTLTQAAGAVGNLGSESRGFTALQEEAPIAGRGGAGWAMWTSDRRLLFESYCRSYSLAIASDEGNYRFLIHELLTTYKSTVDALRRCTTLAESVFSFGQTYERPYGTTPDHLPGYADRLDWAIRALAGARGNAAPAPASEPAQPVHRVLRLTDPMMTGDDVRELQRRLAIKEDGIFGRITETVLMAFQEQNGLVVDGICGEQSWTELSRIPA